MLNPHTTYASACTAITENVINVCNSGAVQRGEGRGNVYVLHSYE